MEYINAADEDDVFADLESHLSSLQFLVEHFLMRRRQGKQSGTTNALNGKPMLYSWNTSNCSSERTVCPCGHFGGSQNYWEKISLLMTFTAQCMSTYFLKSLLQLDYDI
jgi:hypothetical protein